MCNGTEEQAVKEAEEVKEVKEIKEVKDKGSRAARVFRQSPCQLGRSTGENDKCGSLPGLTPIPEKNSGLGSRSQIALTGYEREDLADLATGMAADWESGGWPPRNMRS